MMGAGGARGLGLRGFAHGGREKEPDSLRISDRRMLLWFYRSLLPHWRKVAVALFAMLASTGAGLAIPLVLKHIFDDVIKAGNLDPLPILALFFLGLTVAAQALGAARTNIMHLLGLRFSYDLRMRCFRHMIRLDLGYFQRQRSGDIMSRISNDVGAAENMVVHGSDDIISNSLFIIGAVAILFWMDWRMALVALAPIPIYVACLWVFAHYIRPIFSRIREELGEINAKLQERLAGIQVIKAFGREEAEEEYFDESAREFWRMSAKSVWMWSTFFPAMSVITSCGLVVLVWYGAGKAAVAESGVTAGTVVAFMGYMQQFYRPIGMLARVQNTVNQCLASMARVFQLLDEEPDVQEKEEAVELDRVEGRVEIENVSFRYETGETVLQDVSITAEPGETVAIVGRSGAGKTSLINLIARFYDPIEGRILVDGHDLRDVTLHSLRRNIAMVLQETFLFNTTVKENILYGRPDAPEEDVFRAARAAHAHRFITGLENGYDTKIGERGVRLSGGEKQRIAIARAFLADPRILILDEATSMVDTEAEQIIQQALRDLMQGRTTFVIAHRLSTIRNANKIVVIDDGQVVEQDRHRALMEKGGLYADMVNRQVGLDLEETEWDGSMLT